LVHGSRVIVQGDNHGGGFLAALDRGSGEIVWRVGRKNSASFASPVSAKIGGKEQILLSGQDEIKSYDPKSGEVLWKSKGPATTTANTMVWNQNLVFASGGYPQRSIMAVKADGSGTVVWEQRNKVYVPSMLLIKNHLLAIQDDGIARCFKADSGDEVWSKRLGGNFSASPTAVGDYVMVPSESGTTYVFKVLPKFELVAENNLDSAGFASPVICNGRLYLRTDRKLYCIGNSEAS
jgi:outer membrane protein assembly factor BamB